MAYEEMSREEAGGVFFRTPAQPQMAPVETEPLAAPSKPIPAKAGTSKPAKVDTPSLVSDVAASAKQMKEEAPKPEMISPIDTMVNELISNWQPIAIGVGVGVGAKVGGELLRRSIQKKASEPVKIPERIEPTMAPESAPAAAPEAPATEQRLTPQQAIERAKAANAPVAPPAAPAGPTYNVPTSNVPQIGVQAPAPAPVQAPVGTVPAKPPTPTVTEAVEMGKSPAQSIKVELAKEIESSGPLTTKTGFPAIAGTGPERQRGARGGVYESAAKIPVGQAFVADIGPGTNTVRNALGQEGYEALVKQLGRPIGSDAEARALLKAFEEGRVGPPVTRDMRKSLGLDPLPNTPGIPMKAAKVGGVAGALMAIADLARAETPQDRMNAGLGILGAILPPGADVATAGTPGVPQSRFEQAALLGSPYAQTEWAKAQRKKSAEKR